MSVSNIKQVPQTRGMLVATANSVRERAEAAKAASLALDRLKTDVRVGAAAVLQSIDDERVPLDEEIGQLQGILDLVKKPTAPAVVNPEPAPEPAAPVVVIDPASAHFLDTWRNTSIWARIVIILVAIVGMFVFLLVGTATSGLILWGTEGWWSWVTTVLVFIWLTGLIVGGFGLGGWLAAHWFARRR